MNFLETFNPLLNAALERYQHFNNPEPRDLQKIFGPTLVTIANLAGADPNRATEIISVWDPAAVTAETVRAAVTEITKPAMDAMELQKAKQRALNAELASVPVQLRSERWDRSIPLSDRSRGSLYAELKAETLNFNTMGCDGSRYVAIDKELQRRDIALSGYNYTPLEARA